MERQPEQNIKVPRFKKANGFYTTEARSKVMSRIRAKNTKSEILLRKTLWGLGIRYRKNDKRLPGKPDIVIAKYKLAIFVDGEFWHGYNWQVQKEKLNTNRDFWIAKIERNMQRDNQNTMLLKKMNWTVYRFWDFQIKEELGSVLNQILIFIENRELGHNKF